MRIGSCKVTFGTGAMVINNNRPVWSPTGERIIFNSDRNGDRGIYSTAVSSTGDVEQLRSSAVIESPSPVSNDGKWLLFTQNNPGFRDDMMALSLDGDSTPTTIAATEYMDAGGTFSPDGEMIAYVNDEAGVYDVYVKSFTGGSERVRVSIGGGMDPIWSADGRTIYFNYVRDIYRVDIDRENGLLPGVPELLLPGDYVDLRGKGWAYDEARDRFILVKSVEAETVTTKLNVITNWFDELKRIAPPSE